MKKIIKTVLLSAIGLSMTNMAVADENVEKIANFPDLLIQAQQGSAQAQYQVAELYLYRKAGEYAYKDGVEESEDEEAKKGLKSELEAVKWFEKSAEQGNLEAQRYLGIMYSQMVDGCCHIDPNLDKAIFWYQKAAAQGDASAQSDLGKIYSGKKHYQEAAKWFEKAIASDESLSAPYYNLILLNNEGAVKQSPTKMKAYYGAVCRLEETYCDEYEELKKQGY